MYIAYNASCQSLIGTCTYLITALPFITVKSILRIFFKH